MSTLNCDIVTPAEKLFTSECYMVVVPGVEGEMGFLQGHAPLVSGLADGVVRVLSDASTVANRYCMQGGYVQVSGEKVIVLADRAVAVEDIDKAALPTQLEEAQGKLNAAAEDDPERSLLEADVRWYELLQNTGA